MKNRWEGRLFTESRERGCSVKSRWKKAALVAALVTVPISLVLAFGFGRDPRAVPFMLKDKPAPNFELPQLSGETRVRLSDLKGRPVVLNFWASWCIPCEAEHQVLRWGARRWGSEVAFLGVVFEDTPEKALAFLDEHGSGFPQLVDPNSRSAIDYGIAGVPETFLIDAQGIVREKYVGPLSPQRLGALIGSVHPVDGGEGGR